MSPRWAKTLFLALLLTPLAYRATAQTRYTIVDMGVLPGAQTSLAYAINDNGVAVGASGSHAIRFNSDGSLGDYGQRDSGSAAYGINNNNIAVGRSVQENASYANSYRALRFNADGSGGTSWDAALDVGNDESLSLCRCSAFGLRSAVGKSA